MSVKEVLTRHRSLRWAVPVAALVVVGVVSTGVLSAQASPNLPNLTAAQLLAEVEQAQVAGFSGQVVENASLGLPELPNLGGGQDSSISIMSLLSGSHTSRVWFAGPDKQRFALLGTIGETDVFHSGTELWQWDSNAKTATHTTLPAREASTPTQSTTMTPQQLAEHALAAIDPSTVVTTDQARRVAGRDAYDLVLTPRDTTSRVGSVRIAIDSEHKIPLAVQVFARGTTSAAIDVSFTSIDFSVPADSEFAFTPPKTAIVKQQSLDAITGGRSGSGAAGGSGSGTTTAEDHGMRVVGTGWTSVLEVPGSGPIQSSPSSPASVQSILNALAPVSGTWGSGRLFDSKLVTALITDDGRIFIGMVEPSVLYAAATASK